MLNASPKFSELKEIHYGRQRVRAAKLLAVIAAAFVIFIFAPSKAEAVVAFDATSTANSTAASYSWTHTPVGTPTTAIVNVTVRASATFVSTTTYGGVSMTFVRRDTSHSTVNSEVWILNNPPAGARTVTTTLAAAAESSAIAVTVTGSDTAGQPANQTAATGNSTGPTVTVTSTVNRLVIGFVTSRRNNTAAQITAGAGQTERATVTGATTDQPRLEATDEAGDASVVTSWTFTNAAEWTAQAVDLSEPATSTYEQSAYRWFANNNSSTVGATLTAAQDASTTLAAAGGAFRLRMLLHASTATSTAGTDTFKLQYASTTPGNCGPAFYGSSAFVDVATSTGEIRYNDNALPADGALLGATSTDPTHGGDSIVNQTYEEANNFTVTSTVSNGGDGKWDFSLIDFSAPAGTTYCFRAVKSDGSSIATSTSSKIPEIRTGATEFIQERFRWYANGNVITPTSSLAAEDAQATLTSTSSAIRLRMNVRVATTSLATSSQAFKLQFSNNTSTGWADVAAGGGGGGTPTFIQVVTSSNSFVTAITLPAFPASVGTGNIIIVGAATRNTAGPGTLTVTDNKGNTYSTAVGPTGNSNSVNNYIFYAANVTGGTNLIINVSSTVGDSRINGIAAEYSGIATSAPFDVSASSTGVSTSLSSGATATTTQASELVFGHMVAINPTTIDAGTGYTERAQENNGNGDIGTSIEDKNVTSTGKQTCTATRAESDAWIAQCATFKAGAAASTSTWTFFDNTSLADQTTVTSTVLSSSTVGESYTESNPTAVNPNAIAVGGFGEWDFVLDPKNATTTTYYFRMVKSDGTVLNSYTRFPVLDVASPTPSVTSVVLNGGSAITLTPNTTTSIAVNFTVTDANGCADVFTNGNVTTTVFRSGVGSSCALNNLNCYAVSTSTHNCSGGSSANATATVDIYYFAQATDASSSFPTQDWVARVLARDSTNATGSATSTHQELNTLLAINITTSSINYGTLNPTTNTGATNQTTTVQNAGNASSALRLSGTALTLGSNSIATSSQRYATSSFTFGGNEQVLSSTATDVSGFLLTSPTSTARVSSVMFWGIAVPGGTATGTYTGTDIFTAVFNP